MLIRFFQTLRAAGVPVSLTEILMLLAAREQGTGTLSAAQRVQVPSSALDEFYWLARAILVKDERHYDRFDRAFAAHFRGAELAFEALLECRVPADWLENALRLTLSEEEKAKIESLGGWTA